MSVLDRRPPACSGGGPASPRAPGSTSSRQGRTASSGGCLSKALAWGDTEWTRWGLPFQLPRGKLSRPAPAPHLAVLAALLQEVAQSTVQVRNGRPEFLLHVAGYGGRGIEGNSRLGVP